MSFQQLRNILEEVLFSCFPTTLNDTFEQELSLEDEGYDSGSESLSVPTSLHRALYLYHISASENLSFGLATPWWPGNLNTVCCCLTFEEDDASSLDSKTLHAITEHLSPAEHQMAHHLTSAKEEEDEEEEHFPTAPWDDNVWMEEPVPDRHLCIHEHSQYDLCPYPCPYSLDRLHLTPEYVPTPQYMDLSDTINFPDVITSTSDADIPNLEDVLKL